MADEIDPHETLEHTEDKPDDLLGIRLTNVDIDHDRNGNDLFDALRDFFQRVDEDVIDFPPDAHLRMDFVEYDEDGEPNVTAAYADWLDKQAHREQ